MTIDMILKYLEALSDEDSGDEVSLTLFSDGSGMIEREGSEDLFHDLEDLSFILNEHWKKNLGKEIADIARRKMEDL